MFYAPYKLENFFSGVQAPGAVIKNNSDAFWYWVRALYHRLCSTIEFKLPDEWNRARDYFEACLFARGYLTVFYHDDFGTVFQDSEPSGYDFYYQPVSMLVTNPLIKESLNLVIGEDCENIKLTNDFRGCLDIIYRYAAKLANMDAAIDMNIINSKFGYLLTGRNKMASAALKMAYDKMQRGEPMVIIDKSVVEGIGEDVPFELLSRDNLKNSYLVTDLINDAKSLIDSFDSEIGIKNLGVSEKRERMISSEVEARQSDASARISLWGECLDNSIKAVNEMFGLDISYRFRFLDEITPDSASDENNAESEGIKQWVMQSQR